MMFVAFRVAVGLVLLLAVTAQLCTEECFHTIVNTVQTCVHVTTACNIDTVTLSQPTLPIMPAGQSLWLLNDTLGACCLQCVSRANARILESRCIDDLTEDQCANTSPPFFCEGGVPSKAFHPGDACRSATVCPERFSAGACCGQCVNIETGRPVPGKSACENADTEVTCVPTPPLCADGEMFQGSFTAGVPCRNAATCPMARRTQQSACCLQCADAPGLSDCARVFSEFECTSAVLFGCGANATTRTFVEGGVCRGSRCPPLTCNAFPQDISLPESCRLGSPPSAVPHGVSIQCGENASFSLCFAEGVLMGGRSAVVSSGETSETCELPLYFKCAEQVPDALVALAVNGGGTPTPNTTTTTTTTTTGNGNGNGGTTHEGISIITLIVVCVGTCILIVMLIGCIVAWQRVGPRFSRARGKAARDFS